MEEGRKIERGGEGSRQEEICGEIIIPGVTVATFYEVDVNKIELHNPFQFHLKRDAAEGRVAAGMRSAVYVGEKACTSTHTHFHQTHSKVVAGDVCCLQTGWEAHHCL